MGRMGIYGTRKMSWLIDAAGKVDTSDILDGTIAAADVADSAITHAKLGTSAKKTRMTIGCMGTFLEDSFPFNEITLTEQAAAYCKVFDTGAGTEYYNLASSDSGAYTNPYQLFPDSEATGDAVFFGAASVFGAIYMDVGTGAAYGDDAVTWKYWNGTTWSALTIIYDFTDADDQDGDRPFQNDGYIVFSAPADWALTTVDSKSAYWIKALNTGTNISTIPTTNSKEHQIPSTTIGEEAPFSCTVDRGRFQWKTSAGSTKDSTVVLCNLTSGVCSAEKTLAKGKNAHEVADFALTCSANDVIALFAADQDGAAEFADGVLDVVLTRT